MRYCRAYDDPSPPISRAGIHVCMSLGTKFALHLHLLQIPPFVWVHPQNSIACGLWKGYILIRSRTVSRNGHIPDFPFMTVLWALTSATLLHGTSVAGWKLRFEDLGPTHRHIQIAGAPTFI
ncbi:hypothetical protein HGRIS_007614 [Hohenbuehelia grisea]|uniref:Uncharacterized protein n=1 Tax=Hohenbuehelia grisea TaxID=104357 RepID=A0ABR3J5S1_9AGAR